jgi:hypothetical protein
LASRERWRHGRRRVSDWLRANYARVLVHHLLQHLPVVLFLLIDLPPHFVHIYVAKAHVVKWHAQITVQVVIVSVHASYCPVSLCLL